MITEESERRLFARARELTEAAMNRIERHRQDMLERDRERGAHTELSIAKPDPERSATDSARRTD